MSWPFFWMRTGSFWAVSGICPNLFFASVAVMVAMEEVFS